MCITYTYRKECRHTYGYGVVTVSRIDQIIGLFGRISSLLSGSFAKETYTFKEPTHRSHPMRHVAHINTQGCVNESCLAHEWVMSHTWMNHVSHVNESSLTHEWVMSHTHEHAGLCERFMSRTWMSHVPHMNESCLTREWIMSHTWMSHVTHTWTRRAVWTIHVPHMNEVCHTHVCVIMHCTHEHAGLYEKVTSRTWMSHVTQLQTPEQNLCCRVLECVAMCCRVLPCVAVCCRVLPCAAVCCRVLQCVAVYCSVCTSHIWMSHVTHMNESRHTYEWVMPSCHVTLMNEPCVMSIS